MKEHRLKVEAGDEGERIDVFLARQEILPSRAFGQRLIKEKKVLVNSVPVKASYRVEAGDVIDVKYEEPKPLAVKPEPLPLEILYEDSDLIVVNKPRGMVVHPGAGNTEGTLVNALLAHCRDLSGIGGVLRPGIVHRLDKDTSGVLVVAKNDFAHLALAKQLKERSMTRKYLTLVRGRFPQPEGTINAPIGRDRVYRKRMSVLPGGRHAVTHYKVLEELGPYTFLEVRLETGRTHQIRVHMHYIGRPVVGDPVYGKGKDPFSLKGQALHAATLGFIHPRTFRYMEYTTPLPKEFQDVIDFCRKKWL